MMKRFMVYFFGTDNNRVKIGHTSNLYKRRLSIETHCPDRVELLGIIQCKDKAEMTSIEKSLHKQFKEYNTNREWFRLVPEICAYIQEFTESGKKFCKRIINAIVNAIGTIPNIENTFVNTSMNVIRTIPNIENVCVKTPLNSHAHGVRIIVSMIVNAKESGMRIIVKKSLNVRINMNNNLKFVNANLNASGNVIRPTLNSVNASVSTSVNTEKKEERAVL